jgi:predicted membrane-bound spermidine synthase
MIGIILASLSIGYALGGRFADREDASVEYLSRIIFLAGIFVAITYLAYTPFLEYLTSAIRDIRIGSVIAGLVLFLPASVFLGMASPYTVKLALKEKKKNGSIIGDLSAIGTIGSILGTFLTGYILLPHYGVALLLGILPIILILLSMVIAPKSMRCVRLVTLALFLLAYLSGDRLHARKGVIHEADTLYSHVSVIDRKDPLTAERLRTLAINIENHSSMSLDSPRLVNEYTKYYHLLRHFVGDFQNSLMIGGAGYSFPKDYLGKYEGKSIDVVEIDPGVTEIAKEYFSLDTSDSRLRIFHEDARVFLDQNTKKYDAILGDAFTSWYSIPYQLTTREAIQSHYDALTDSGVLILNIISAIEGEK